MRKDKALAALLVILLAYSAFATWEWRKAEESRDKAIDYLEGTANHAAMCLEQSVHIAHLLEENASDETLVSVVVRA